MKTEKKKLPFGVSDEFVGELESSSIEQIKAMIVRFQEGIDEAQTFLKTDEKVLELKSAYDEAKGPSVDTVKALRNRTKLAIDALKKSGG